MKRDTITHYGKTALSVMFGSIIGSAAISFAGDNQPQTSDILGANESEAVIPYSGFLSEDGAGIVGSRELRFDLYDSDAAGATSIWNETKSVDFFDGRFSTSLGSSSIASRQALRTIIGDGEDIYIGITVDPSGSNVALSGRHKIEPAPFAVWSSQATDLRVSTITGPAGQATSLKFWGSGNRRTNSPGKSDVRIDRATGDLHVTKSIQVEDSVNVEDNLVVDGNTNLNGPVTATAGINANTVAISGSLDVNSGATVGGGLGTGGDLDVGGEVSIEGFDLTFDGNSASRGDGGRALVHYLSDTLIINFNSDFAGGVEIGGPVKTTNTELKGTTRFSGPIEELDRGVELMGQTDHYIPADSGINHTVNGVNRAFTTDDGFCFLAGFYIDHGAADVPPMQCVVQVNGSGQWTVALQEGTVAGVPTNVNCYTRCVRWR